MDTDLTIGTRVKHPIYGAGIILDNAMEKAYCVVFKHHGEKYIEKQFDGLEVLELAATADNRISLGDFERVLTQTLRKWADVTEVVKMGEKWEGGTMTLQPANSTLKPKEIPIETFFHKIVMIRDRMRVLEQQINSSKNLSDEEKVNLQQYITRCYGSLTTFNVLFKHPEDGFKGDSKD
jgi:superoxide dismutase